MGGLPLDLVSVMNVTHFAFSWSFPLLAIVGGAVAQQVGPIPAEILANTASSGLPGRVAGSERWIVHFKSRSFDLDRFAEANAARRPAGEVQAIVRDLEERLVADQAPFVAAVRRLGGVVVQQWWLVNAAAIEIPPDQLMAVRLLPNVAFVQPDEARRVAIHKATNADNHAADALQVAGHVGAGVAVAIIDTGQDSDVGGSGRPHRTYFLGGNPTNRASGGIGGSRLLTNQQIGRAPADDVNGHGTGVASIAAGANWGTSRADHGHAPAAGIAGYAIAHDASSNSDLSTIATAWQAVARDRSVYNIVAANMSYTASYDPRDVSSQAMDSAALNADLVCVAAAGNSAAFTVSSPCAANGLAVGAVVPDVHTMATFSARGPLFGDADRFYPDLVACGVDSVMAERDREQAEFVAQGTSMAAPQVCGAAVQLRARFPALTALQTKAVLLAAARDVSGQDPLGDRNSHGVGLLRNDHAHSLAESGQYGTGAVSTLVPHDVSVPVQAGKVYQFAITWFRRNLQVDAWSNLNLEVVGPGGQVIAVSATRRNLYEFVRFQAPITGNLIMRTRALLIEGGGSQDFAFAWQEAPPLPLLPHAHAFGAGCGPMCGSINPDGGILTSAIVPNGEVAYEISANPGTLITGLEIFGAATRMYEPRVVGLYFEAGGVIKTAPEWGAVVDFGLRAGFYRPWTGFRAFLVPPSGRFWIGLDQTQLLDPNLTSGTSTTGYQRPVAGFGDWTRSTRVLRPAIKLICGNSQVGHVPAAEAVGWPRLGATVSLPMSGGPANSMTFLALGYSKTTAAFGALPLAMTPLGAPGCRVLGSADSVELLPTGAAGNAQGSLSIPSLSALAGLHVYAQYIAVAPGANALGVTFSNAVDMRIGL